MFVTSLYISAVYNGVMKCLGQWVWYKA